MTANPGPATASPGSWPSIAAVQVAGERDQLWMAKSALSAAGVPICTW